MRRKAGLLRIRLAAALGGAILIVSPAAAVRPFVTDDARIADKGQLELEAWTELVLSGGALHPGLFGMGGITATEWLQILAGGGFGLSPDGTWTFANPVIQPKMLIWPTELGPIPGLSLATGITLPFGSGHLYDAATGFYAVAPVSFRLLDDWFLLHINLGVSGAIPSAAASDESGGETSTTIKPQWGLGFDVGVAHEDIRFIAEAYSGDPFEALGPDLSFQWGARWLKSDWVNVDLTFGTQPVANIDGPWEFWSQVGVRLLFDTFTSGPGSPLGGRGMMPAPGRSKPSW